MFEEGMWFILFYCLIFFIGYKKIFGGTVKEREIPWHGSGGGYDDFIW